MRPLPTVAAVLLAGALAGLLAGCASPTDPENASTGAESSSSPPMSSTDLPTTPRPTAPSKTPSDPSPTDVVAGRVTAIDEDCHDVTTDDGKTWSLTGDPQVPVQVGTTVRVRIEPLAPGETSCGTGEPARIVSLEVVG